jgi:hypothetical protein
MRILNRFMNLTPGNRALSCYRNLKRANPVPAIAAQSTKLAQKSGIKYLMRFVIFANYRRFG